MENVDNLHTVVKIEPLLDIKTEELDISDSAIDTSICSIYLKSEIPEEHLNCTICDYKTTESTELEQHTKAHQEKLRSSIITRYFASTQPPSQTTISPKLESEVELFKISKEEYESAKARQFKQLKCYKCNSCEFTTPRLLILKRHMEETHLRKKLVVKNIRRIRTDDRSVVKIEKTPQSGAPGVGDRSLKCDLCSFTSKERYLLNAHIRTHGRDKEFKCSICQFTTAYSSVLKDHMHKHLGLCQCKKCVSK